MSFIGFTALIDNVKNGPTKQFYYIYGVQGGNEKISMGVAREGGQ